jgi:predicted Zn-dependent protease
MASTPATSWGSGARLLLVGALFLGAAGMVYVALRPVPAPLEAAAAGGKRSGQSLDEILNAVVALKRESQYEKADIVLAAAIKEYPEETSLFVEHGEVLVAMQRLEEAVAAFERAAVLSPSDHGVRMAAGTVSSMAGRLTQAKAHYEAAQNADKTDWRAPMFLAQVQLKIGGAEMTEQAKKNLLLSGRLNPESATVWGTLADVALRENKVGIALQHIERARGLEPDRALWRLIEARILKRDGQVERALLLLTPLDEADQREPGVMQTMAECYGLLKRPMDAAMLYASASDANPGQAEWAMQAALWLERAERHDAALRYAQRAMRAGEPGADALVARLSGVE